MDFGNLQSPRAAEVCRNRTHDGSSCVTNGMRPRKSRRVKPELWDKCPKHRSVDIPNVAEMMVEVAVK